MASPFANAGLGNFGNESKYYSGATGEKEGLGQFILGAYLTTMGVPPQVTSMLTGAKTPPINQTAAAIPPGQSVDQSMQPVQPGVVMQDQNIDPQVAFGQGFKKLFSHLPTFGNK